MSVSKIFRWSGIYGLTVVLPSYFMEQRYGREFPPPVSHPEFYYGFAGLAATFQVLFLLIATDPVRFRPVMLIAVLEKFSYGIAASCLYFAGRLANTPAILGVVDLGLGFLFLFAWRRTPVRP